MRNASFNEDSLKELFCFINETQPEINQVQNQILNKKSQHYHLIKIIDMYYGQIGYDKEIKEGK